MGIGGTRTRRGGQLVVATGIWLAVLSAAAGAQFFSGSDSSFAPRPPLDVPSAAPGPAQSLIPPSGNLAPTAAAKGPMLQSLPGTTNAAVQAHAAPGALAAPSLPAGHGALTVSARFGRDLPTINSGLHWRVYRTEENGLPRLVKEDRDRRRPSSWRPGLTLSAPGSGLASVTKAVQVRAETMKDVFEIPAGGLRIEGRVGAARIPQGQ